MVINQIRIGPRGPTKTNDEWVRALRTHGIEQEDALKELREKLLRGMRAYRG